ncbi:RNA methyltransferase [Prevotella cerevisiae]|uniref:RNA methyltransferase n=1 Tax=Segatella cerevisiae TaxID=2053716 RepID=A0ABT1BXN9_9BACT|nr:RNA methyltransferase [Segatella cerevisiae]MCO6025811.1 RNA methyltransferase [Segatella cerevisiae]
MISKATIKYIRSLDHKKIRNQEKVFVAEGPKVVGDLLAIQPAKTIIATKEWMSRQEKALFTTYVEVSEEELKKVSFLQHPQNVLAVFDQREVPQTPHPDKELTLALDGVQDPGNLGTIIRISDWFGIESIVCSLDTVDVYNPKVVQATMGSIARVNLLYTDLLAYIAGLSTDTPIYGTFLDGKDIYTEPLTSNGLLVMGNEGNGISESVSRLINHRLLIPNYPEGRPTADSLNVAIATAITCSEFRRNGNRHQ